MDDCPLNIRILICSYIPVAELFRTVAGLARRWNAALATTDMLKELLRVNIGISEATNLPADRLIAMLKSNAPGCFSTAKPLAITGFGVSGGDELTSEPLWLPAFLFSKDANGYSSRSTDGNVVVGGFLSPVFAAISKEIEVKAKDCEANGLLQCSRRDFVQEITIPKTGETRFLGCVHGVYVSRRGVFSCPLSSFFVFASMEKLTVCASEFEQYFHLGTVSEIYDRFRGDISGVVATDKFEMVEFRPTIAPLQPVVWGKFLKKRCTTINQKLRGRFLGRYFYILLVGPDDRMREYGDFHASPNIDLHCVHFLGRLLTLYH